MTTDRRMVPAILVALGMLACSMAAAAEEDPGASGQVVVGGQGLSEDPANSAKFFEYREVPSGFVAERVDLFWEPRPLFFFDVHAYDISQADTRGSIEFGRVDLWRGSIAWSNNPRLWGDDAEMLWAHQSNALFTLDDTFQAAVQAAPAAVDTTPADGQWDAGTKGFLIKNATEQAAQDITVGHQRRTAAAAFTWTPTQSWIFSVDTARERRSGTAPQSLGNYFSIAPGEVAAPVDFRTDWANLGVEYRSRKWNAGGRIGVSRFETGYDALVWDNQLSLVDQPVNASLQSIPGRERLLLGADNDALTATLFGGVNLPGHTRIDATFSATEVSQDDPFLPMTINTQLTPLLTALPQESLDGKHRYSLGQVRVSSRPTPKFRWSAWARFYELDNRSPSLDFAEYVQTDYAIPLCGNANACGAVTNRIARRNLPYSYERETYGGMVGWQAADWFDVSLGYELYNVTREFSAVEETSEDRVRLTFDFDAGERVTVRTTAQVMQRRADEYHAEYFEESFPIGEANIAAANEGMRRYIWTDRDREAYSLFVDWTASAAWTFYAQAAYARDDYSDPETGRDIGDTITVSEDRDFNGTPESIPLLLAGRTFDRERSYGLGAVFAPKPRFRIFADYTWEEWEYRLVSRYRNVAAGIGTDNPLDDWGSDATDEYRTASLGLHLDLDKEAAWKLDLDGSWSRGQGDLTTDFVPGGAASGDTTLTAFPQIDSRLTIAMAQLTHDVSGRFSWTVRYWYENWDEDNWASDDMQPYMGDPGNDPGSVNSVYLGLDFDNYTYQVLSVLLRYGF